MTLARLVLVNWWFHLKQLTRSQISVYEVVVQPVILGTLGVYMFKAGGHDERLMYVVVGAGLMGVWVSTLYGSGAAIQDARYQGTLELLVVAPAPFLTTMLGVTLATATLGLYSVAASMAWGALVFGVPLAFAHPLLVLPALVVMIGSLGALGLVLASTFILLRNANALSNLLEFPVWLVSGMLTPVALLPAWCRPISDAIPPTWGVRAVRDAVIGGRPVPAMVACVALGLGYFALGLVLLRSFERRARANASLPLA